MSENMEIKDIQWAKFMFIDIFEIKNGFYNKKPEPSQNGDIPFIGATQNNNGITEFLTISDIENNSKIGYGKNEEIDKKIFNGNCIVVTNNGSVGFAYYQAYRFTCSHDVNPLYLKNYLLNKYIAKFLISAIEKQRVCFEYARKWRPKRMKKSSILLPVNSNGEPDYSYMEQNIKDIEGKVQYKINDYIDKGINIVSNYKEMDSLDKKEWGEFFLRDIFSEIQRGKRLTKGNHVIGKMPYVSSTCIYNGIDGFIGNERGVRIFNNCITLANSGSVGSAFFHKYSFVASDHVTKLKETNYNQFVYLFISTILKRLGEKYSFNREINDSRIQREKIILPVNSAGNPDYEYMENYIKKIEYEKLIKYKSFKLSM